MNMTEAEQKLFHRYLHNAEHYLEFGSGSSTLYASQLPTLKSITTVESSLDYVRENLLTDPHIKTAVQKNRILFHLINIGETGDWGYPVDSSCRHLWPNYSLAAFNDRQNYDLILVDGRFRVACILAAILSTPENSLICVHDFWNRPAYHIVLKYLNVEDEVETLGIFSKKREIDREEVQMLLQNYIYFPGK